MLAFGGGLCSLSTSSYVWFSHSERIVLCYAVYALAFKKYLIASTGRYYDQACLLIGWFVCWFQQFSLNLVQMFSICAKFHN